MLFMKFFSLFLYIECNFIIYICKNVYWFNVERVCFLKIYISMIYFEKYEYCILKYFILKYVCYVFYIFYKNVFLKIN